MFTLTNPRSRDSKRAAEAELLKESYDKLAEELSAAKAAGAKLDSQNEALRGEVAKLSGENIHMKEELQKSVQDTAVVSENAKLKEDLASAIRSAADKQSVCEKLTKDCEESKAELSQLEEKNKTLTVRLEQCVAESKTKIQTAAKELREMVKQMREMAAAGLRKALDGWRMEAGAMGADAIKKLAEECKARAKSLVVKTEATVTAKLKEHYFQLEKEYLAWEVLIYHSSDAQQAEIQKQKEELENKGRKIAELGAVMEVKEKELAAMQQEVQKTFSGSEEYLKMVELLNQKDAELSNNESQVNQMLIHINDLESEVAEFKSKAAGTVLYNQNADRRGEGGGREDQCGGGQGR